MLWQAWRAVGQVRGAEAGCLRQAPAQACYACFGDPTAEPLRGAAAVRIELAIGAQRPGLRRPSVRLPSRGLGKRHRGRNRRVPRTVPAGLSRDRASHEAEPCACRPMTGPAPPLRLPPVGHRRGSPEGPVRGIPSCPPGPETGGERRSEEAFLFLSRFGPESPITYNGLRGSITTDRAELHYNSRLGTFRLGLEF